MSLSSYQALIRELAGALGVPDMRADESGYVALTIDAQEIHLQYDEDQDQILLFTRLSTVSVDRAAETYGLLLSANLFWQGSGGATFSIDFDTGRVFLANRQALACVTLEVLEKWLEGFAEITLYWLKRLTIIAAGGDLLTDEAQEAIAPEPDTVLRDRTSWEQRV